jgi:hypothetical protein
MHQSTRALTSGLWALALFTLVTACARPVAVSPDHAIGGSPSLSLFDHPLEVWTKPDLDARQFAADEHACYVAAVDVPPTPDLILGGLVDVARIFIQDARESGVYYDCMAKHGYRRV